MVLEPGFMCSLTDQELISALRQASDEMTDTPVEWELLRRFEKITSELGDIVTGDISTTAGLLEVLSEEEYEDPEQLAQDLEIVRQIKHRMKKIKSGVLIELIDILTELE